MDEITDAIRLHLREFLSDMSAAINALSDAEDPAAFALQLIAASPHEADESSPPSLCRILYSVPVDASFVDQLAVVLATWFHTQRCPLLDRPAAIDGVSTVNTSYDRVTGLPIEELNRFVVACQATSHTTITDTAHATALVEALGGARGLLTCLGFRETTGSRTMAPLTRAQCVASFQQLNSTKEKLTVGARAFTKHCVRSADSFWGELKGNDLVKNAIALACVAQLMDHAVWKNIHSLPHSEATLELRNGQGYGVRWYVSDQSFRGFLEPPMENGHENRWRH